MPEPRGMPLRWHPPTLDGPASGELVAPFQQHDGADQQQGDAVRDDQRRVPRFKAIGQPQRQAADEDRYAAILERIPAGWWGMPDDMMGPAVFLAALDYINGYTIAVDGGWLAR